MKVIVTGGGGYIGSIAVERLVATGHDVTVLDNFAIGHRAAVHPDATVVACDLRDADAVARAVSDSAPDAIMHFAALSIVPESVREPGRYFATNTGGGLNVLEAARTAGVTRFVFSSTASVYGVPDALPVHEEAPKRPINPYGQSKLMMEQMVTTFAERYGINHAMFRYFNVAGATVERGEHHDPETHLIPVALHTLLGRRDTFHVFGTDYDTLDGTAIRDYVHVIDLVDAHILAVEALDRPLGAMNLGTTTGFSVQQIVDAIERVTGHQLPVQYGPRRQGDPPALIADSSQARGQLGWSPDHSTLEQMIRSAWDWFRANPEGYTR